MPHDKRPEVSVVMPVYNAAPFLDETVESILEQTYSNWELVAVDDESSDNSLEILHKFEERDPRVRPLATNHSGIASTRNAGIEKALGTYIAGMDNDDAMLPQRLELQVEFLRKHRDFVAVGASAMLVDADGDPLNERRFPTSSQEVESELLNGRNPLMQSVVLFRKDALLKVGGYRDCSNFAEDYDLFLRLLDVGRLGNLPEVLVRHRQHVSRASASHFEDQNRVALASLQEAYERRSLTRELPKIEGSWHPNTLSGYHTRCASDAWDGGHIDSVRKHARALWAEDGFSLRAIELYARTVMGRRLYDMFARFKALFRPFKRRHLS